MNYQTETMSEVVKEIMPLLHLHWQDVALNHDSITLDPNWQVYQELAKMGFLHITTARTDAGELVGYAIYIIQPLLHYKRELGADGDIFWLHPDHRKGSVGIRLLKEAEMNIKALGCTYIVNKVKLHKDVGRIFERLGYQAIERVYAKALH
jgi:GNAT superfamily N-acetyltransferase